MRFWERKPAIMYYLAAKQDQYGSRPSGSTVCSCVSEQILHYRNMLQYRITLQQGRRPGRLILFRPF